MATIKMIRNNTCWQGRAEKKTLVQCSRKHKLVQPRGKQCGGSSNKLILELPYDPAVPLWGIKRGLVLVKILTQNSLCLFFFFTFFSFIDFTEKGREGERGREKRQSEIEPTTFQCVGMTPNQPSHTDLDRPRVHCSIIYNNQHMGYLQ